MLVNDIALDLTRDLPRKWKPVATPRGEVNIQEFASTLRYIHDKVRKALAGAHQHGLVTGRFVEAAIKAEAMDILTRQVDSVDGRAFALAVQQLILALIPEED